MRILLKSVLVLVLYISPIWATETFDTSSPLLHISIVTIVILAIAFFNHKKLQSMVKEKTNEMEVLLNAFDENVIASKTDLDGKITYASKAFCKITGYSEDELIGSNHNIIRHPDMEKEVFEDMWRTILAGDIWKGEIKNLKKDGSFYWVEAIVSPQFNLNGEIIGYSAIRQNLTSQKEVEVLSKNLENVVEDRTTSLKLSLDEIQQQNIILEEHKQEIESTYRKITESINYAALIQNTLVPHSKEFIKYFKDDFIIWKQKDIVGGDIYLFDALRDDNECLMMVIDCTGHGVPGAFVTMLVKAIERQLLLEINNFDGDISPSYILYFFNKHLVEILNKHSTTTNNKSIAGFDGGVLYYNIKENILKFAGANIPLFIMQDNEIRTIKGDRYSIGISSDIDYRFTEHTIDIKDGVKVYISSDGYTDQTGGENDFPFGKTRLLNLIKEHHNKPFKEQKDILLKKLEEYKSQISNNEYNDDITMVALDISPKYHKDYKLIQYSSIDITSNDYKMLFTINGLINQRLVVTTVDNLEMIFNKLDNISSMVQNNIIYISIELIQNLISYSNRIYKDRVQFSSKGIYNIGYSKKDKSYFISTVNFVRNKDILKLKNKLDTVTKLSKEELKKSMKELRRSGKDMHSRGAGLGIIEIARKSTSIDYNIIKVNELESACEIIVHV